ncbi:hypothetical protein N9Z45_01690, partial [Akkermansiaceae bacterium]|nr:hypothetical protein [Akkermansiaceae bacterium]
AFGNSLVILQMDFICFIRTLMNEDELTGLSRDGRRREGTHGGLCLDRRFQRRSILQGGSDQISPLKS